jgi:hypothetical protein
MGRMPDGPDGRVSTVLVLPRRLHQQSWQVL